MNKTSLMAALAAVVGGAVLAPATALAQNQPIEVWQPPQGEADPARRIPAPAPATDTATPTGPATSVAVPVAPAQPYYTAPATPDLGGLFLGVQGGKGWVFDDIDQSALLVNAGYRWQAGSVTLVGIEAAAGRLDDANEGGMSIEGLDYASIGANARFNFGAGNPVFALVRAGYWQADDVLYGGTVDGGYVGVGLGVDINRHFNLKAVYTNHVYFSDYGYYNGGYHYDFNRADTLMLGAEVRF